MTAAGGLAPPPLGSAGCSRGRRHTEPGQASSQYNYLLELEQNKAILRNPVRPVEDYFNSNTDVPGRNQSPKSLSWHILI